MTSLGKAYYHLPQQQTACKTDFVIDPAKICREHKFDFTFISHFLIVIVVCVPFKFSVRDIRRVSNSDQMGPNRPNITRSQGTLGLLASDDPIRQENTNVGHKLMRLHSNILATYFEAVVCGNHKGESNFGS